MPVAYRAIARRTTHITYKTFHTRERRELSAMHITASVWINNDEPASSEDPLGWLDKLAPPSWRPQENPVAAVLRPDPGDFRRHRGREGHGDAHWKDLLIHDQVIVPGDGRAFRPQAVAGDRLRRVRWAA